MRIRRLRLALQVSAQRSALWTRYGLYLSTRPDSGRFLARVSLYRDVGCDLRGGFAACRYYRLTASRGGGLQSSEDACTAGPAEEKETG